VNEKLVKQVLKLKRRAAWLRRLEQTVSSWFQGWIVVVIAAFVTRVFTDQISWRVIAFVALGQVVFSVLLILTNWARWSTASRGVAIERKMPGGG
jgi:predicted Na+-dependent transporter